MLDLTVLCKVVDNYGDIGFVFRLCRSFSEISNDIKLRLVVSNLESFAAMADGINPALPFQSFRGWQIYDWNNADVCKKAFSENPPVFLLECFQCGRPDWLEDIIFAKDFDRTVNSLDVEYLTAEDWAEEFHLIKSGTRSINVKKHIFMPGFTEKTGGLVLDSSFMEAKNSREAALKKIEAAGLCVSKDFFNILVFSYPRNFDFLVKACNRLNKTQKVKVYIANGICTQPFLDACQKCGAAFQIEKLPYLQQEQWDALLTLMDFSFVRGEDSFSRACLCGKPFVWHIYKQEKDYHLVKLEAFHKKLGASEDYNRFSLLYNGGSSGADNSTNNETELEDLAYRLLKDEENLRPAFKEISDKLISLGNMAQHLLEFLSSLI
ncbi:MAG: elongation factor P maturation arginine rhamnosyltransferase EarP [Spirochaetaceae bacterium]|nr:elongation factor P maturation arginine rhamnosyltransferase EarP [Spirochaetaceae bacterium]